jgi:hypothetical protein
MLQPAAYAVTMTASGHRVLTCRKEHIAIALRSGLADSLAAKPSIGVKHSLE